MDFILTGKKGEDISFATFRQIPRQTKDEDESSYLMESIKEFLSVNMTSS